MRRVKGEGGAGGGAGGTGAAPPPAGPPLGGMRRLWVQRDAAGQGSWPARRQRPRPSQNSFTRAKKPSLSGLDLPEVSASRSNSASSSC